MKEEKLSSTEPQPETAEQKFTEQMNEINIIRESFTDEEKDVMGLVLDDPAVAFKLNAMPGMRSAYIFKEIYKISDEKMQEIFGVCTIHDLFDKEMSAITFLDFVIHYLDPKNDNNAKFFDLIYSPAGIAQGEKKLEELLTAHNYYANMRARISQMQDVFGFSTKKVKEIGQAVLNKHLQNGDLDKASELGEYCNITELEFNEMIEKAGLEFVSNIINKPDMDSYSFKNMEDYRKKFKIKDDKYKEVLSTSLTHHFSRGLDGMPKVIIILRAASPLLDDWVSQNITEPVGIKITQDYAVSLIKKGDIGALINAKRFLNLTTTFFTDPENISLAQRAYVKNQLVSHGDQSENISSLFLLDDKWRREMTRRVNEVEFILGQIFADSVPKELLIEATERVLNNKIEELKKDILYLKTAIYSPDFNGSELSEKSISREFFKAYIRLESASWGDKSNESFDAVIKSYAQGGFNGLNSWYKKSDLMTVKTVDTDKQKFFKWSEPFEIKYKTLLSDIQKSYLNAQESIRQKKFNFLSDSVAKLEKRIQLDTIPTLKNKISTTNNEFALKNLKLKVDELENIDLTSFKDNNFQKNITILLQYKELDSEIRQCLFYYAFIKNKGWLENDFSAYDSQSPTIMEVGRVISFIDHLVNHETFSLYFPDGKAAKKFRELVNCRALEEELARAQNQDSKGTTEVEFVPCRNLLTEFSGHISDACWASKYNSILREFPNFTSLFIRLKPESKFERLAGACLLIEAESNRGPVLIIRGLNPIENVINQLSVEDFFNKLVSYIKEIAVQDNRKVAVVIDGHSGGAASNRPVMFDYLCKLAPDLDKITLSPYPDTTFNGYDISDDCYLLSK